MPIIHLDADTKEDYKNFLSKLIRVYPDRKAFKTLYGKLDKGDSRYKLTEEEVGILQCINEATEVWANEGTLEDLPGYDNDLISKVYALSILDSLGIDSEDSASIVKGEEGKGIKTRG